MNRDYELAYRFGHEVLIRLTESAYRLSESLYHGDTPKNTINLTLDILNALENIRLNDFDGRYDGLEELLQEAR